MLSTRPLPLHPGLPWLDMVVSDKISSIAQIEVFNYLTAYKLIILPSRLRLKNTPTASLQRDKTTPNECPVYDTKKSDGEVPAKLELWGMQSTPSLLSLPGPLWPRVVATVKGPIFWLNRTNRWLEFTVL